MRWFRIMGGSFPWRIDWTIQKILWTYRFAVRIQKATAWFRDRGKYDPPYRFAVRQPVCSEKDVAEICNIHLSTAGRLVDSLVEKGIPVETTGHKRNQIFVCRRIMEILNSCWNTLSGTGAFLHCCIRFCIFSADIVCRCGPHSYRAIWCRQIKTNRPECLYFYRSVTAHIQISPDHGIGIGYNIQSKTQRIYNPIN